MSGLFQVPWSDYRSDLLDALGRTVSYTAVSFAGAVLLGLAVALLRLSKAWPARAVAAVYTEVFKNVPLLAIIFLTYFGLASAGIRLDVFTAGCLSLVVFYAAYLSEIFRSAISGVHAGQTEAGEALGAGAAFVVRRLVPTRAQVVPPARPRAEVPALADGEGLVMVSNTASGTADRVRALRDILPAAEVVECEPADVRAELEKAAARARVLGVCGGDGTVNAAAEIALRHGLPLAVLPGGTLNHFAYDLGVEGVRDLGRAVQQGEGVHVDVGRFACGETQGVFLNTLSLGVYPELVRERERWTRRIGGWPAGVIAALRVVRADRHPLEAEFRGRARPLWLLFVGNGTYHRMGLGPGRRSDLADGQLDVRVVHGGRRPAARLLAAALAGPLTRSPVHAAVQVGRLNVASVAPGTLLAYDGEVIEVEGSVTLEKLPQALTVYRPSTGS